MAKLRWANAEQRHAAQLQQFVCTDPPKRTWDRYRGSHHPRPWEMEVQSHLRGLHLPRPKGEMLLLGFDGSGIAAAFHFGQDDQREHFMIWAGACAQRCKGQGIGTEGLAIVMDTLMATKKHYALDSAVFTHIDPRNYVSQQLVEGAGFEYLNEYDGYQTWIHDL